MTLKQCSFMISTSMPGRTDASFSPLTPYGTFSPGDGLPSV